MTKIVNCYSSPLKKTAVKNRRLSFKTVNLIIGFGVVILGAFYLFNINDLTVKGFALKNLKAQAASLADEQMNNEENVNALQSYYSLNTRTEKLNMVAVGNIEYLSVASPVVAKK